MVDTYKLKESQVVCKKLHRPPQNVNDPFQWLRKSKALSSTCELMQMHLHETHIFGSTVLTQNTNKKNNKTTKTLFLHRRSSHARPRM